ncbi:peptidase S8 [Paenibacillus psychroresistens]|uniref:Peptidase S8 n=2 Tax=Paenibacillus psychroresistens TaxID=1778678 RepID=A0A6B8RU53_9BACL|nr:peptidase S8 [Paenibacillus psychroresistens]
MSAQREIELKQQTVSADVRLTDELCRSQCSLDFHQKIKLLNNSSTQGQTDVLEKMITAHPHMTKLIWSSNENKEISVGSLSSTVTNHIKKELLLAKQSTAQHKEYQSLPLIVNGQTYFVLGVPSPTNKAALIGVMHQKILTQVAQHQVKHLRVVPYPADNHWKIESVDSSTLRDVKVDQPHQNEGTSHYHKNQVVVKFKKQPTASQLQQIKNEIKSTKIKKLGYTYVFQSATMDAKQLMAYFKKWNIEYVEPHYLYLTNENPATIPSVNEPNDLLYSKYQWNLPIIETAIGWGVGKGSENVIVAVVDTGADLDHPDLQGRLKPGYNVIDPASPPMDDVGHGTHVAGVISALVNNGEGVAGMTWYNPVMPVKVLDETGAGNTYNVAQGIIWAADHGAKVINMSLGNYADANFLHDAIKYAFDKDIVLIAASGNDNTEEPGYPAAYPEVLAVAASDNAKKKATFSNFGNYIGVAAPGVNIPSTYPHNQYAALSGTSMASPHVTALAALIRSINPKLKNTEVMEIMRRTAEDLGTPGKDKYFGYGQIDVIRALQEAEGHTTAAAQTQKKSSANFLQGWFSRQVDQINSLFS